MKNPKNELLDLLDQHPANAKPLSGYDGIWFLGDSSPGFVRAHAIAERLNNFKGVVVGGMSPAKRSRICAQVGGSQYWSFIGIPEYREKAKKENLLLVDFNDSRVGLMFRNQFELEGLDVVDYLRCMSDLGLTHTYLPVNEERSYFIERLDDFIELIDLLEDDLSKKTVLARLKAFITLDRRWLVAVSQEAGIFTKNRTSQSKLLIQNDEIYVDAGAAHGDTVTSFFDVAEGVYKKIYAFEPDPLNYRGLATLCKVIPNSFAFQSGLSDAEGKLSFYESAENRFGSRFLASGSDSATSCSVDVVRLDDIVKEATLIKIDVEGFEKKVINGAKSLIEKCGPSMHVSGYHYPQDLPDIIHEVRSIRKYKKTVVRHYGASVYDTNILFSDRQEFG